MSARSAHVCKMGDTYSQCELEILKDAAEYAELRQKKGVANSPEIAKIMTIVENFIKKHKLLCYGGTAINRILPPADRIYNAGIDLPDYDFYSPNALRDAKQLADEYLQHGFSEVEAKGGVHHGTYKVFVNFIGVADVTQMPEPFFKTLSDDALERDGMLFCPANFLRMSMYVELSRPAGDVTRWVKVFKRLSKLNKHFPLELHKCADDDFQRTEIISTSVRKNVVPTYRTPDQNRTIADILKTVFIENGVVFFGAYAFALYIKYMPEEHQRRIKPVADYDVLAEDAEALARQCRRKLQAVEKNVTIVKHVGVPEIIPVHYEICVGIHTVAFIYSPLACHSYNITDDGIKVATIDTILSLYLAFIYSPQPYYNKSRLLCMSDYLFKIQQYNRLEQTGLLQRFSVNCIGHQETLVEMRIKKMAMHKKLQNKKGTTIYDEWFLRYRPHKLQRTKRSHKSQRTKRRTVRKHRRPKRTQRKKRH